MSLHCVAFSPSSLTLIAPSPSSQYDSGPPRGYSAMWDSGSQGDFIHPRVVKETCLPTTGSPTPISVTLGDDKTQRFFDQTVTDLPFFLTLEPTDRSPASRHHRSYAHFHVMETGYDFILGTPWSRRFRSTEGDWATNTLVLKTKRGQTYRLPFIGTTATPRPDRPPPEPSVPTPSPSITVTSPRQFAHFIRQEDVTFFMVDVTDLLHYDPPCPDAELIPLEPDPPSISMSPISTSVPPSSVESTPPSRADADPEELARYTADLEPAVHDLIREYHDVFPSSFSYAGILPMRDVEHSIQLVPDYRVHHQAPYRLSIPEATELKRQLEELLRLGFIKPINFPWGAPVLFARKADETLRLCIDYPDLNRNTVKNNYPMPRSDELFDRLAGNRFFTKIDLRSGYHQIRVAELFDRLAGNRFFTKIDLRSVMPFALTNAPATFQRAMNDIFRDILEQYVLVYLDDILVYSRTLEEHLRHLRGVLDRLRRRGFYAKLSKCRFAQHKVDFLGHYVSDQGLHMDDAKITAIAEWPAPTSVKQLRRFLGLTSYYSNFIRGYARYSYVLTSTLLWKNPPWAWTPLHEDAFRALKKAVTCAPVLHLPDFDSPFILTTDASDFAVGAVLSQVFPSSRDSSHPRIPRFPPPTPTTASRQTPTRPATDEPSIDYSPTIAEDGTVESRSGDCPIAFYSRQLLPAEINYTTDERELRVRAVAEFHDQAAVGHMGFHKTLARVNRLYVWPKGKDFVKDYVAECPTCQEVNSANHLPYDLLQPLPIPEGRWQSISMDFIGPLRPPTPRGHDAILVIVDRFTKRARFVPCRYAISAHEVADIVFDRVVRDHGLPLRIISDRDPRFTSRFWRRLHEVYDTQLRFSSSYHPQTNGQTEITNRTLGDILRKIVVDDQQWDLHLAHAKIAYNHAVSPATGMSPYYCDLGYHPRVPADFLRPSQMHPDTSCPALDDWVAHMTSIMKTAHEHIAASQTRMAARANRSRMDHPFKVGDDVLIDARHLQLEADTLCKFRRHFFGPCRILQAVGSDTTSSPVSFRVKLPDYLRLTRVHDVYHVSLLRPYRRQSERFAGRPYERPPPLMVDGHEKFLVSDIIVHRVTDDNPPHVKYLVRWKGYPDEEATWEPLEHLQHARMLVRAYDHAHRAGSLLLLSPLTLLLLLRLRRPLKSSLLHLRQTFSSSRMLLSVHSALVVVLLDTTIDSDLPSHVFDFSVLHPHQFCYFSSSTLRLFLDDIPDFSSWTSSAAPWTSSLSALPTSDVATLLPLYPIQYPLVSHNGLPLAGFL
ncbi:hypothetical protein CBR_g2700 [Chara braunii]|uniref:Reverse transcriptase n=1 Tax=Chara braunii TaxID=69332 RepID=A0A388KDM8_CHABU|nr:hypothetical protein CBR_g2700 [Chara braunii]|eukprot:GBG68149.1 hypothetical protein CBR_g2700 [Chara braunii]